MIEGDLVGLDPRRRPSRALVAVVAGATLVAGAALTGTTATAAETEVDYSFDFGGPSTPVAPGFVGVHPGTAYSAAQGYGFTTAPASNGFRDRGGDDPLRRDFTIANNQAFAVDVPNGTYEVTTWAGDLIAGNATSLDVEGTAFAGPRTSTGIVHEQFFPAVTVADGQLNLRVTGGDGRINGVRVQTPLAAPSGLAASAIDADGDLSVTLEWEQVADATGYAVFRAAPDGELAEVGRVSDAATTTFADTSVALGESYEYAVATVKGERVSKPSERIPAAVVDPDVAKPAAPTGMATAAIDRDSITLTWTDPGDAVEWRVFRSTRADIPFEFVASVDEPTFTDTDVLTTRPYLYQLVALNAGGTSPASETYATEIATTLVRQAEYLDRAPVAVATAEGGVYLGWRLLGLDPRDLAFNVYRDGEKITDDPITGATNVVDPDGTTESTYLVTALQGDREVTVAEDFGVWSEQFLDVPLDKPADGVTPAGQAYTYAPGDASVGDLDGDGEYELVFQWYPSNAQDNSRSGYTGNVYLEAVEFDGTRLWRIDLGRNIRAGAHYTQFQVFDLDGDGRAEVSLKTADGTVDGTGAVIGDASADHRNSGGYILTGPEFLTVFDGATGAALDTVDYVPGRGNVGSWGDTYGNRVDRFLAATAYLDGEHPSLVFSRGYYTRTVIAAWDFRDGELLPRWTFDTADPAYGAAYEGQGNHNLTPADVDRDGLDEIVFGSMTIDDDGTPLYNTRLGHGDALHVTDHIVDRPGLEVFAVHESPSGNGGIIASMRDAETGEVIWSNPGNRDTGRGVASDIDPNHAGSETWNVGGDAAWNSPVGTLNTADGELIGTDIPAANFVTWWDGDLTREITDHDFDETTQTGVPTVSKWDPSSQTAVEVLRAEGTLTNNGTKGNPMLQADLFGDWREELVVRHADGAGLRVYTTVEPTEHRLPTLMHDSQYRQAVAWQNTAYNQPPHPSYFLGVGMAEPPVPSIAYAGAPEEDASAPVVAGLPSDTVVADGPLQLAVTAEDPESGIRSLSVTFDGEEVAPDASVDLTGLAGERVVTARAVNHAGLVTETASTVLVVPTDDATTAPGRGTLSNTSGWEYGLHDGNFDVVMNLWHGTPGSIFRLYENGALIETKVLSDGGDLSQTTGVSFEGKPNGTYVYTGELINSRGTTATTSTTVKVTDAAPAVPVVSTDQRKGANSLTATANLWWGTNATSWRIELDGAVVGSGPLVAATPGAQSASVKLTGLTAGEHTLVAVFANANGETASKPVKVTVK
jgi:fibronectin type 3 domain-containing protein